MFYSFEISNWHGFIKKVKAKVKSGKRNSQNYCPAKKGTFFGKEVLRKCAKSHAKKEMQKGEQLCKMVPIIYIKGRFMKHPCMAMCEATNRTVIRDEV